MAEVTAGALQIVQAQQQLVGKSVVGGSAALSSDQSSAGILEQIRDITLRSFRKTSEIASTLVKSLSFEKQQARIDRDKQSELALEAKKDDNVSKGGGEGTADKEKKGGAFAAIFATFFGFIKKIGTLLVPASLVKLFAPLTAVFSKGGLLARLLGPLGPIGLVAAGLFLIIKYSDDIAKALGPVLEKLKQAYVTMKPFLDGLSKVFDYVIKGIISGIGNILSTVIDDVMQFFGGFSKLFQGDIMGGVKDIFSSILKFIFRIPYVIFLGLQPMLKDAWNYLSTGWDNFSQNVRDWVSSIPERIMNGLKSIGSSIANFFTETIPNAIKNFINGIIDSLPLPGFVKDKLKIGTSQSKTPSGTEKKSQDSGMMSPDDLLNQDLDTKTSEDADAKKNEMFRKAEIEYYANRMAPEEQSKIMNKLYPKSTRDSKGRSATERFKDDQKQIALQKSQNPEALKRQEALSKFNTEDYIKASEKQYGSSIDPSELSDREKFKFMRTGKVIDPNELDKISPSTPTDKILTPKRKSNIPLLEDAGKGGTSVVNSPVNSSTVVNNSQPTINYTKMDTGVDRYTEKLQYSF